MALSEMQIPVTFSGGIDTKTDSKSVASTRLLALENGIFDKNTTIAKRTGYVAHSRNVDGLSGTTQYGVPKALGARGDELVLFADDKAFSYRSATDTWNLAGRAQSIVHTERAIVGTGTDQSMPDAATYGGVAVVAWEDSRGGVWWAAVDSTSGRLLRLAEQINANAQTPRVLVCGTQIHLYYAVAAAGQIWCAVINPVAILTTPTPAVMVATLSSTNSNFDAQANRAGTGAVIAWALDSGGHQIAFVDPSGVLGSAITGWPGTVRWAADAIDGPLAIVDCASFVGVFYAVGATVHARLVSVGNLGTSLADLTVISGPISAITRIAAVALGDGASVLTNGDTDVWVWAEESAGLVQNYGTWWTLCNAAGVNPAAAAHLRGHGLVSRGFSDNGAPYVLVAHDVPFFPYVAALRGFHSDLTISEAPEMVAVGRLLVGESDGLPTRQCLTTVETDASDARVHRWIGCAREQVNASSSGGQFTEVGLRLVTLDFDSPDAFQSVEFGEDLVIAGAMPLRYDGDSVAELGFHCAPDGNVAAVASAGGLLTESESYLYTFCYEEVDAQGVIHPGPMSVGTLVALAAGQTRVTLSIPTYRLTSKRRVRIGVFRSEGNDTNDSPDMYRVTSLNPSATGSNGYIVNDTTVDTVSFVDDLSDVNLLLKEHAYTNGGVLSNDPIGLGSIVASGKDRLFFNDPTDPHVVRFTQARRDGYGPEVCADLSLRMDQVTGSVGAIGVMDDALLIFKERGIDFVAGNGPLANPDAAPQIGFSPPQQIPSDVGCTAPRSLAVMSDRIMFQGSGGAGIYQIDRSRQVGYVGAPVEGFNAQAVTSADVFPGRKQVVFLTSSGKTLLYDYLNGQWATWTNHEGLDAVSVAGVYHYLRANIADYRVFRSDPTIYLDGGVSYLLYLETAWIKLAQVHQGLQKIWYAIFLGAWKSSHVLSIKTATDYRPGWDEPHYIEADASETPAPYGDGAYGAGPYGGDSDAMYQQRIHVGAKCQAIRFAVGETMGGEFSQTPPIGASFELTEMLLTGGIMRGSAVFGAGRTQ